ncbi:hypothetical protein ACOMHN_003495 [Nucella lapillus]
MLVNFITDARVAKGGFSAGYWATYGEQHGCGGVINSTSGVLRSFDADGNGLYENNLNCGWTFFAGDGKVITFNLTGLNIEHGGPNCAYDYVAIYDGTSDDDPLLGKYCGDDTPPPAVTTSTNAAYVVFHTDGSIVRPGFNMTYTQRDCSCRHHQQCPKSGQIVWCGDPRPVFIITIRNGTNSSATEVARLCGAEIPDPVFLSSNTASLSFITDLSGQHLGYDITYVATTSGVLGCGGDIQVGINSSLTSPNFPGNFTTEDTTTCTWTITVPARRQLRLNFTYLAVPGQADCAHNYVEVFNGPTVLSPTFGQFCTLQIKMI